MGGGVVVPLLQELVGWPVKRVSACYSFNTVVDIRHGSQRMMRVVGVSE
jgi:hypothetical protein